MHPLVAIVSFVCLVCGITEAQRPQSGNQPTVEFVVVEARWEPLTPEASKKLAEIEESAASGKLSAEQASRRREQVQRGQDLLLFGYFGAEPRALIVQRTDADSVKWSTDRFPAVIRFERQPAIRGGARVFGVSVSGMPRKGWEQVERAGSPEAKYRVHPWLEQPDVRAIELSIPAETRSIRFVAGRVDTVSTTFGSFTTGASPDRWVLLLSFANPADTPFVGWFDVVDSTGRKFAQVEVERPLDPGQRRDVEVTVFEDPRGSRDLKIRSIAARTSPSPQSPESKGTSHSTSN